LKIVIVGPAYPLRGGIAHHTALLYQHLSEHHKVRVITFKRQYPALLFPGQSQLDPDAAMRIPTDQLLDSVNPLNWVSIGRRIRKDPPDLLIVAYSLPFFAPCFGTLARVAKKGTNTKVLFLCHNVVPHEARVGDRSLTRFALGAAEYFIVQSETVKKQLLSLFPRAVYRMVHHPVYSSFGEPVDKPSARQRLGITEERVLLCFGYVRPYKGLHVLIDAMRHVIDQCTVKLFIVGEFYDNKQKYVDHIQRLALERNITMKAGYLPNDMVGLYFSAADAVMLPYLSASQSGIAQIAYNFDKPVIATNVGGLAEVVRDNVTGFLVPPGDSQALAKAIVRFYNERKENEFSAHVRTEKLQYGWEAMRRAIESFTQEAIEPEVQLETR
jgi:glycosyltransferase involved in cell wall biosynthesis